MERTYDIFEINDNGDPIWRAVVAGLDAALARAKELASRSTHEFRVMHLPTNSIAAVLNAKESPSASAKELPPRRKSDRKKPKAPSSRRSGHLIRFRNRRCAG